MLRGHDNAPLPLLFFPQTYTYSQKKKEAKKKILQ
jgi:hypothetical protein